MKLFVYNKFPTKACPNEMKHLKTSLSIREMKINDPNEVTARSTNNIKSNARTDAQKWSVIM